MLLQLDKITGINSLVSIFSFFFLNMVSMRPKTNRPQDSQIERVTAALQYFLSRMCQRLKVSLPAL